jgi:hypothetical protein
MKRVWQPIFLGSLAITLAVIFIAECSSKNDVKSNHRQGEKGSYQHHRSNKLSGKFA